MTLKQLQTFYWVCRLGSFVAAAERLHSTQSTVSMRIQDLESSLGIELIDRSLRSIRPTPKGEELLRYVEQLMGLVSEMEQRLVDPRILSGRVRLGVTELVAVTWLSELIGTINEKYPRVTVELVVDLTSAHLQKLGSGELDLALIPGPASGFAHLSLGTVEFAWMASPKLQVPKQRLRPQELTEWPMLALTRESKLHHVVAAWFERNGTAPFRANMCNSIGILSVLTAAGLGISYLPYGYFTDKMIKQGRLQVLDTAPGFPPFEYCAVFDERKPQPFARMIAELAQRYSTFDKLVRGRARRTGRQSASRRAANIS